MKPTLVTIPPRELRDRLQNDPTLGALLAQGYTIGTSCVLVDGPEGPEQRMEFALVLVPPIVPLPAQVVLPRWVQWATGAALVLMAAQVLLAILSYV